MPSDKAFVSLIQESNGSYVPVKSRIELFRQVVRSLWLGGVIMKRNASAIWRGGLQDGQGAISADSGVLSNTQYSFSTRFENGIGTNPEELIAAAHAGCFSMALSAHLGEAGLTAH